eukprot:6097272-Pyramimonas_sp.AAC.1
MRAAVAWRGLRRTLTNAPDWSNALLAHASFAHLRGNGDPAMTAIGEGDDVKQPQPTTRPDHTGAPAEPRAAK